MGLERVTGGRGSDKLKRIRIHGNVVEAMWEDVAGGGDKGNV